MHAAIEVLFSPLAQRIGWALIHFLWQGTAVALLLALALSLLRNRSAQARWTVSFAALALMALLPVVTAWTISVKAPPRPEPAPAVAVLNAAPAPLSPPPAVVPARGSEPVPAIAPPEPTAVNAASPHSPVQQSSPPAAVPWSRQVERTLQPVLPWAIVVWFIGVLAMSVWHLGGWLQVQRLKRSGTRPVESAMQQTLDRMLQRLRMRRRVRLLESLKVAVPVVAGWLRPVILLPVGALAGLTPAQIEAILAHELAHIRRWDCLVQVFQVVIETPLFYHPAVWWVSRQVRQQCEQCCDDLAVHVCGDRRGYALALAKVAEFGAQPPALALAATGGKVLPRIRRILGVEAPAAWSLGRCVSGVLALATIIAIGISVGVSNSSQAQPQANFAGNAATQPAIETLKVEWHSTGFRDPILTLRGDGSYLYEAPVLEKVPGNAQSIVAKEPYRTHYQLAPDDLRRFLSLLEQTQWLSRPTPPIDDRVRDGTKYTLTLRRGRADATITIQEGRAQDYEPLIRFLRRIEHQERVLFDLMQGDDPRFASYLVGSELNALAGKASTVPVYAPVLDHRRLAPAMESWLAAPDQHTPEQLAVARQVLAQVNLEADQRSHDPAAPGIPATQPAVIDLLTVDVGGTIWAGKAKLTIKADGSGTFGTGAWVVPSGQAGPWREVDAKLTAEQLDKLLHALAQSDWLKAKTPVMPGPTDTPDYAFTLQRGGASQRALVREWRESPFQELVAFTDTLVTQLRQRGPGPAAPDAEDPQVQLSGQVVDAETGQPVEQFTLEWGWSADPKNPEAIGWGWGSDSSGKWNNGQFSVSNRGTKGQKMGLRVLAEGYLPELVTPQLLTVPAKMENLVVKLQRGATIRGIVLDHAGKPVAGADVFLAGGRQFELTEGTRHGPKTKSGFVSDKDGHFAISGAGPKDQRLAISAPPPGLCAWVVSVPDPTRETTIKLPAPAALTIRYDIPGAPDHGEFRLELATWDMPQWENLPHVCRLPKAANGKTTTLSDLPPGVYDLARVKTLPNGAGYPCDRRTITLESGKPAEATFARPKGAPVHGRVEGLAQAKLSEASILVQSGQVIGDSRLPLYADALTCGPDGAFTTETLLPGTYNISVEAYGPETDEMRGLGIRGPDFVGSAKVTVPETGQPPEVKVQIKPRSESPTTQPATQPAAATATLTICYDIPGAPDEAEFRVASMTIADVVRQPKASNGQTTTVVGLTPGKYDVSRCSKTVSAGGDLSMMYPCDRRIITVEAGQRAEALFTRPKGAPVRGKIEGLVAAKMPGVIILVQSGEATGYNIPPDGRNPPLIEDVLTCGPDGAFTTETLMPGTYSISVDVYGPETEEMRNSTAFRLPDFVGSAKVTVPETGQPPEVKVQIKPRSESPATMPATPAAGVPATQPAAEVPWGQAQQEE